MKYTFQEDSPRSRKMCTNLSQFVFLPNLCRTKYDIPTMSQNLQNFVNFQKFQLENLVDFEKCCKTHLFLQKIGADTAENEQHFAEILPTDAL